MRNLPAVLRKVKRKENKDPGLIALSFFSGSRMEGGGILKEE